VESSGSSVILVISPLVELMEDQVDKLNNVLDFFISSIKPTYVSSDNFQHEDLDRVQNNLKIMRAHDVRHFLGKPISATVCFKNFLRWWS
jgi:superfamily II DNA helicase RecQ